MGVVLVVDSQGDVVRNVLDAFAAKSGLHAIIERRNGRAALSALRDGVPVDAVVCDDRLEDMDGIEFLEAVRRIDPDLPVIMTSGQPSVETYLKAINNGVFDFITRPVSTPLLRRVVAVALRKTGGRELVSGVN